GANPSDINTQTAGTPVQNANLDTQKSGSAPVSTELVWYGFEEGMEIPIYYDPMIAKLIAHGATRQEAIDRMIRAIDDYRITGIQTTLDFCRFALSHQAFQSGNFDTKFVERYFSPDVLEPVFTEEEKQLLAALAVEFFEKEDAKRNPKTPITTSTNWPNRLI
ncbi:MAG: hypothetical protein EB038_08715, partial [Cyclobacteriaceae bacterium]|nr:hypothetical protein [Cyclobacteriaceae bacterium]